MQLKPYTITYDGHISHHCTAITDDGRRFDLSGAADTDWQVVADRVCALEIPDEPAVSETDTLLAELASVQEDLAAKTEELATAEALFEEAKTEIIKLGGVVPVTKPLADVEKAEL